MKAKSVSLLMRILKIGSIFKIEPIYTLTPGYAAWNVRIATSIQKVCIMRLVRCGTLERISHFQVLSVRAAFSPALSQQYADNRA